MEETQIMKTHTRVAVIGGGVVGASVLYHLAKAGWSDVCLLERDVLTCGSSWHAAGGFHTINGDPNVAKLQHYTINLYKEIEELSGQSCGVHMTGGVMLAADEARMEWLRMSVARGKYLGLDLKEISLDEALEVMPLFDKSRFVGAVYDPLDGHLDPSGVVYAYAKSARKLGATIYEKTKVEDLAQNPDGTWRVLTDQGEIQAEHVVNAGGLWGREVGRMVGLELPILAMEHHYLLTEAIPEVQEFNARTGREIGHAVDFKAEVYTRQERDGMLIGTYEQAATPWSPIETPWEFGQQLLEPDFDRISPSLETTFEHFPCYEHAGVRQAINGPFTFAPDGNPMIGPVRGLRGFWCAVGIMAGFSQGGGVGLSLANWITEGDPGADIWGMDIARYGDWASMAFTNKKVCENYSRRFRIQFPNEELPAARPYRTTPIYDTLVAKGAVMGVASGLEIPLWYADAPGVEDVHAFRRSTDFEHVGAECRNVRENVGISEVATYAKYDVTGSGAKEWLDTMLAGRLPAPGRMSLCPMLNPDGKVIGDFTVSCRGENDYFIVGSGAAEDYHMRWFQAHLPEDDSVDVRPVRLPALTIAGPKSRELLQRLAIEDVSGDAFKFLDFRKLNLDMHNVWVGRVSYTGDLGYEIWIDADRQRALYNALWAAGADLGLKDFGSRALMSLRSEKWFGSWAREFRPIYTPMETGLNRFCSLKKNADFIGRAAYERDRETGGKLRLSTFVVEHEGFDIDARGDEPIFAVGGDVAAGWVTSGGFAHWAGKSVAYGYLPKEMATEGAEVEIEILGNRRRAVLTTTPLFDPDSARLRS